jgi:hypothetical protein
MVKSPACPVKHRARPSVAGPLDGPQPRRLVDIEGRKGKTCRQRAYSSGNSSGDISINSISTSQRCAESLMTFQATPSTWVLVGQWNGDGARGPFCFHHTQWPHIEAPTCPKRGQGPGSIGRGLGRIPLWSLHSTSSTTFLFPQFGRRRTLSLVQCPALPTLCLVPLVKSRHGFTIPPPRRGPGIQTPDSRETLPGP